MSDGAQPPEEMSINEKQAWKEGWQEGWVSQPAPINTLTIKLMSMAVHVDEWLETGQAEAVDRIAIESLLDDPEVVKRRAEMDDMGLLPVKR